MMNSMRSFASSFVSKILLVFLVITFGVWGVGDILRNTGDGYAARVGDDSVSIVDFQRQKSRVAHQIEAMGMHLDVDKLDVSILRQLIQGKLITETMRDLGFYVNDRVLAKVVRAQPAFQNKDGSFSSTTFHAMAQAQHLSEDMILQELKDETASQFLMASLDMSDVIPPASVRSLASSTARETRDAWIVTVPATAAPLMIDDAVLHAFYEKNKSVLYVQPETRTLEYVTLKDTQIDALVDPSITPAMLDDAAKADPKATKKAIHDRLRVEQRDHVLHDLQNNIDDALAGGASLGDALAKSGVAAQTHQLTDITAAAAKTNSDEVTKTVADQGLTLGEGETSGLITTPHGTPVIVHVKTIRASTPQPYEKVASDVRAHVGEQMRQDAVRARVQEVKEALNALTPKDGKTVSEKDLQIVFKKFGLSAHLVRNLARPVEGPRAESGIPPALQQAIFERPVDTVAGPMTLDNDGQMLAYVTAIAHPAPTAGKDATADKTATALTGELNQSVQMRAFLSFAKRHPVEINPRLMNAVSSDSQP